MALLSSYGRLGLAAVLEPAIRLAEEGFPAPAELVVGLSKRRAELAGQPSGHALYPNGLPPSAGTRLVRDDLAQSLRALASGRRDAFYLGEPGAEIVRALSGVITNEDLARSQADWVKPIGATAFGLEGWTIPPNSQGYLTLAAARIFESLDPPDEPDNPEFWHLLIESYRAAAFDRDEIVADPEHMRLSAEALVDHARTVGRAAMIRRDAAGQFQGQQRLPGGTAYLCSLDKAGLGVSLIQSNFMGFGSGIGAGRAGFFLHNRGAGFDLRPGHPNRLAPGKRPLHTLSPTLWTQRDRLACLLGTRGADYQPQILLAAAAHLFLCGMDPATVQSRPRWVLDDFGPWTASRPKIESTAPSHVVDGLRARGHEVSLAGPAEASWGPVSIITVDASGLRRAAADPRVDSASASATE
jgi:gamma-glutamyltranspeptidase/glutathione hydrolase